MAYNPWLREDTQEWISLVESRLDDMNYYKTEAQKWCYENDITDTELITRCIISTCIWVSQMRQEHLSFGELYDLIGVIDPESAIAADNPINFDHVIEFKAGVGNCELEVLLSETIKSITKD
jgi:hypothetical protein